VSAEYGIDLHSREGGVMDHTDFSLAYNQGYRDATKAEQETRQSMLLEIAKRLGIADVKPSLGSILALLDSRNKGT
jgi:hypothetical protein